jgi:transcriptional regulator with XRE-family HTH domain
VRQTLEQVLDDLGRRLAELRREHGWTQAKTADATGMPEKDYQAIENGRRAITVRTALVLAQAFDVPIGALFDPPVSRDARRPGRPPASPPNPAHGLQSHARVVPGPTAKERESRAPKPSRR